MKEFQDTEILKIYESIGDSASDRGTILSILEDQKKTLDQKLTPTLSSDQKYEYSGNFKKGAWSTWEELAKPANNPIGRSALIALEYKKKVEEKVTMSAGELLQGEGYLPKKECATFSDLQEQVQENNPDYIEIEEEEDVDDDLCPTGSIYAPYNAGADADGCIPFDGTANTTYGQGLGTAFNVELQNFTYDPSCERWETQTPGKLISNSINRASDQQFEGLTQADEFSEIASAALGSMVDVMINKGLSELKSAATSALDDALGGSGGNSNQGITYLGTDVDQTNPDGSVDWLNAPNGSVVWEREIPEAIRNAGEVMYYLENSVANGKEQLKMTETLDYLYPGPDIGWDDRLKDLFAKRSESEKRYLARKTNPNKEAEERMDRFNLLRRMFVQALTKQPSG